LVKVSRKLVLLSFAVVIGLVLISPRSNAQWWNPHEPRDFEECSESAERNATSKEMRASLISECDAKFAGRRKPGGGYTYYDFMQNRHFDIAGPNPTPEELKQIDVQYTLFLDRQRQSILEAATAEQQMQQAKVELAKQTQPGLAGSTVPLPVPRPQLRAETVDCHDDSLSCGWSRFTAKIQRFKKTLLGAPKKTNHG
jgi:hypothetical protein